MKTFKQFLNEVRRDMTRAVKLGKWYGRRYSKHPNPDMRSNEKYPASMRTPLKDWDQAPGSDEHEFHDKWIGGAATKVTRMKVPVKDLYHSQGEVDRHYTLGGLMLNKDRTHKDSPIQVIHHTAKDGRRGGLVIDGHHRAVESRLAGETHVWADVHHSPDDPPPKDWK